MQVNNYLNINQAADRFLNQKNTDNVSAAANFSFREILDNKTIGNGKPGDEIKFSKHASSRLEDRNITMTKEQLTRLSEGTAKAQEKGIKDSLVMIDSLAFIVNVPNKTVVTAMDQTETDENIFTNIDGAVIV